MFYYFFVGIISFISFYSTYKFSKKYNLLDYPNLGRKKHKIPTPYTGGLAIYLTIILTIFFGYPNKEIKNLIFFSFFIVVLGFIDDKYKLSVKKRVIFQIICFLIPIIDGFVVKNLGTVNTLGSLELGYFAAIFTIISAGILTNAFNYIDGKDGLASSLFLNSLLLLILFLFYSQKEIDEILILLFIIVIIFIFFNLKFLGLPKLFLGDNGSLFLGYVLSFLLIYLTQNRNYLEPALIIWSISFIIYEFIATNFIRVLKLKNPFKAGVDHIHFYLDKKYGLYKTLFMINFLNILLGFIGYFIWKNLGNSYSLILFIILFFCYFFIRKTLKVY
jgi:UDP-GlcNAc:undecaprenyl-phosphate GlcNAc-1-phosphate transferase